MTQSILAAIITIHALLAGISPDYALCIVEHESKFDIVAHGDGGKALGLWQWHEPSIRQVLDEMGVEWDWAQRGDPRLDPVVSTVAAMWAMSERGRWHWWRRADEMCRQLREAHGEIESREGSNGLNTIN